MEIRQRIAICLQQNRKTYMLKIVWQLSSAETYTIQSFWRMASEVRAKFPKLTYRRF